METKVELYSREGIDRQRKRYRTSKYTALFIAVLGLIACIVICCAANTLNAQSMENAAVIVSTLTGWAVIFIILNVQLPAKYEASHAQNMLAGEREAHHGTITVDKTVTRIKSSISVCRVSVSDGARLNINSKNAAALRGITAPVTLYSVHGYVTAYEVAHE